MLLQCFIVFGTASLFVIGEELSANNVSELLLAYESYINASLVLDRSDRALASSWTADFQLKQVNVTAHYRLEMTRHREHSFRGKKTNPKWKDCISLHQIEIKKSKLDYFDSESNCLKITNSADKDRMGAVRQVEKEIRKWRKGYRYLSSTCAANRPDDQAAALCLVEYVKKDNYDVVFQRLIILKLEAMENLLLQINKDLSTLEECLKHTLSQYLDTVRRIMATLNKCYERTNRE